MAEYIDRWALLEEFSKTKLYKLSGQFERLIRQAPSVDVAEVIHGEWTWKQGVSEWISVKERLPEVGTVLATDGRIVITAPSSSVTADGIAITHWMPLPEPPKEGAK